MKLLWHGHACFRIASESGFEIVTDPYTPETSGYAPIVDAADMVVVSSQSDSFHDRHDLVPGEPFVVDALQVARSGGRIEHAGVVVEAIQAMEMEEHPFHDPEHNAMYRIEVDGIRIGHMGDMGNPFNDRQIAFFEGVDILLALAGDVPTIALDDLEEVVDRTRPRLVIPMHFRTLTYRPRNGLWIASFLSHFDDGQVDFAFAHEVQLTREELPEPTRVLVLDYAR